MDGQVAPAGEVGRYRAGVARLLAESIELSGKIERRLDAGVDGDAASQRAALEADPIGAVRTMCAVLLRKVRLHAIAVLRANQACNVHSLAVQARPVLECAGQVVLLFHNTVIVPEKGEAVVGDYLDADFYGTIVRLTKGGVGHRELLGMIASASEEPEGKRRKRGRLRQADKVATLQGGKGWYDFLSEYFCHGNGNLRGASWQGGVVSTKTVRDEFACAGIMDYLANQVAVMNAYALLCPVTGESAGERMDAGLEQLKAVRVRCKALRDGVQPPAGNVGNEGLG